MLVFVWSDEVAHGFGTLHRLPRLVPVTDEPIRIQLRRIRGWRLPAGAISVARPSRWGNPFRVGAEVEEMDWVRGEMVPVVLTQEGAVRHFRESIGRGSMFEQAVIRELRGHDLACYCPLVDADGRHVPCHADVLLAIALGERD